MKYSTEMRERVTKLVQKHGLDLTDPSAYLESELDRFDHKEGYGKGDP